VRHHPGRGATGTAHGAGVGHELAGAPAVVPVLQHHLQVRHRGPRRRRQVQRLADRQELVVTGAPCCGQGRGAGKCAVGAVWGRAKGVGWVREAGDGHTALSHPESLGRAHEGTRRNRATGPGADGAT
jgi:hypothetical protein